MAYFDDHKTAIPQQRKPRRAKIRHVMVHTSQQQPDLVGVDSGAEKLAKALLGSTREASYHEITDRDSYVVLVEDANEAFGSTGGWNRSTIHISMAMDAFKWGEIPKAARDAYGLMCAQRVALKCLAHDVPAQLILPNQALSGILGHGHADPDRRSDPGWDAADWAGFIEVVRMLMGSTKVGYIEAPGRFWVQPRWPMWDFYSDGRVVSLNGAPQVKQLTEFGVSQLAAAITDGWWDEERKAVVLYSEIDGGTFALPLKG
jgi:hypothetical protein